MPTSHKRNNRKAVAIVQSMALLAVLAQPVAAATAPASTSSLQVLTQYKIVLGDKNGDLRLGSKITRGEMATILVRARGLESQVSSSMDLGLFPDTTTHWSRGYVNVARLNGLIRGYDDGTFRPEAEVTYAEAVTMVLRLVGQEPDTTNWPLSVLLLAQQYKVLPAGFANFQMLNQAAIRADIFDSLSKGLTDVKTPEGGTYLQKYVDNQPPVLTLSTVPATTVSDSIQLAGNVGDATSVTVNDAAVTLSGGNFNTTVSLNYGDNKFTVVAADAAGNKSTKTVSVSRNSPVARIDITAPAKVGLGSQTVFTVKGYDSQGREVGLAGVTATIESGIGSFDLKTLTFTAANTAGTGRLVLTAGTLTKAIDLEVLGQAATASQLYIRPVQTVSSTKEMTVEVEVRDAGGALVQDFGRPVTLTAAGQTGLVVTPTSATSLNGVATFKVKGSTDGTIALTATTGLLSAANTTAVFATPIQVVLVAETPNLVIGGYPSGSRIRAELRNDSGNLVPNNSGADIYVNLSLSGQGVLTDSLLTIRKGYTNSVDSGDSGLVEVSGVGGSGLITGSITTGQTYSVSPTAVNFQVPNVGGGSQIQVLGPISSLNAGDTGSFVIRVVDANGNLIPTASYAFQLKIDTSNNDVKASGIPNGVTVTLGNTALNPVDDGIPEGAVGDGPDIIARTMGGSATVKVRYTKGGSVTITPVLINSSVTGYADNGVQGTTLPSTAFVPKPLTTTFVKPAANLSVTVDSDMGNDQPSGALPNNPSRYFTVRVRPLDADGNLAPAASIPVSIQPAGTLTATMAPSPPIVTTLNGVAEFRIFATTNLGTDTYNITSPSLPGVTKSISLRVNSGPVTVAPSVLATRGVQNGAPHANNRVGVSDTDLEMDLAQNSALGNVSFKVYQAGTGNLIYQTPVIDMTAVTPQIRVPKGKLLAGNAQYELVFNNGSGDGPRSVATPVITNARELPYVQLSYSRYDAVRGVLSLYTSGINTVGVTVQTDKFTITNGGTRLSLLGATATIVNSGRVDLALTPAQKVSFESNIAFAGTATNLEAQAGWYMADNGDAAAADLTGNAIAPAAVITNVVYDKLNRQLVLNGYGFDTGNVDLSKLSIYDPSTTQSFLFNGTNMNPYPVLKTANKMVFTLSAGTGVGVNLLEDPTKFNGSDNQLAALDGWLYLDAASTTKGQTLPLFTQVRIDSVSYSGGVVTITGAGFGSSSSLDLTKMQILDADFTGSAVTFDATDTGTIVNDGVITINLSSTHQSALANTTTFSGTDIYLQGGAGWLTVGGRNATPIPTNQRVGGL